MAQLEFAVCAGAVAVTVESVDLAEALERCFPDYVVTNGSRATSPDHVLTVRVEADGFTATEPDGSTRSCATLTEILSVSEFAVARALLARCDGYVPLHASGAAVQGERGVLALGKPGAGKSSLAICWHHAGHPGLGDDAVLVGTDARVHPFKRLYEVDAALLPEIGLRPADTPLWEVGSTEAWYDPAETVGWAGPTRIAVVAVVRYRPGAALTLEPLSRAATLNFLLHSRFGPTTPDVAADRLAELCRGADGYVVTFGAARAAAQAIAEAAANR